MVLSLENLVINWLSFSTFKKWLAISSQFLLVWMIAEGTVFADWCKDVSCFTPFLVILNSEVCFEIVFRNVIVYFLSVMWLVSFWIVCTNYASFSKAQSLNFKYSIEKLSFIQTDFYNPGVIQDFDFSFESFVHSTYLFRMEMKWKVQFQNPHDVINLSYISKKI